MHHRRPVGVDVLGLFAKRPEPGKVKTRLAGAVSPEWAAKAAEAFLLDMVERLAEIEAQRHLIFDPPDSRPYFHEIARSRYHLTPQSPGNLGQRMADFFEGQLRLGVASVVIVGSDSPTVPAEFIARAFQHLHEADLVLGPATDGGYYLIGCAGSVPPVFSDIPWGSERVLSSTLNALGSTNHRLALLPPWYDIDTLNDWHMFRGHVAAQRRAGIDPNIPHTEKLLDQTLFSPKESPSI
jgi:rSAM/selenodomain-associated transferase 1